MLQRLKSTTVNSHSPWPVENAAFSLSSGCRGICQQPVFKYKIENYLALVTDPLQEEIILLGDIIQLPVDHTERRSPLFFQTSIMGENSLFFHVFQHLVHLSLLGQQESMRGLTDEMGVAGVDVVVDTMCPFILITLRCENVLEIGD
jgi:hypothetical protein